MLTVCKRFHFDGAHRLPHYDGKCKNLHGHSWVVEVEVYGVVQTTGPKRGMIVDFGDLRSLLNKKVFDRYDHSFLNDKFENPTAENIVSELAGQISEVLYKEYGQTVLLERVRVYEADDSYAQWTKNFIGWTAAPK